MSDGKRGAENNIDTNSDVKARKMESISFPGDSQDATGLLSTGSVPPPKSNFPDQQQIDAAEMMRMAQQMMDMAMNMMRQTQSSTIEIARHSA